MIYGSTHFFMVLHFLLTSFVSLNSLSGQWNTVKNVLVVLLEVMSLTHHDWNLSGMIIFVKVSHNRTAQTLLGHLGEMRIPLLRRMACNGGCWTPCSRKESHKIQTRVIVCVSDQSQCYGCGLSRGLYCRHCELPKARTGCLESAWPVMDATGNNNNKKKRISWFLAWGKLLVKCAVESADQLSWNMLAFGVGFESVKPLKFFLLLNLPFRESHWKVGTCCSTQKEAERNKILSIFPLGLQILWEGWVLLNDGGDNVAFPAQRAAAGAGIGIGIHSPDDLLAPLLLHI